MKIFVVTETTPKFIRRKGETAIESRTEHVYVTLNQHDAEQEVKRLDLREDYVNIEEWEDGKILKIWYQERGGWCWYNFK